MLERCAGHASGRRGLIAPLALFPHLLGIPLYAFHICWQVDVETEEGVAFVEIWDRWMSHKLLLEQVVH